MGRVKGITACGISFLYLYMTHVGLVFRGFFAVREDDTILKVLLNYFNAVREVFPEEWNNRDNPLSRTIGYGALVKLLADLSKEGIRNKTLQKDFFKNHLLKARGKIYFSFGRYSPSGAGETDLYRDLRELVIDND
jgi:hypothetical protein